MNKRISTAKTAPFKVDGGAVGTAGSLPAATDTLRGRVKYSPVKVAFRSRLKLAKAITGGLIS